MSAAVCPPMPAEVEILLVSCVSADHACLGHIVGRSRWKLHRARDCREGLMFLETHPLGIVIADARLPDGCWKDLLAGLAKLPHPPNLIVSSRLADDLLWAEVLNLGGYDVLLTPFEPEEIFRVGAAAWLEWRRRVASAPSLTYRKPLAVASGAGN